MAQDKITMRAGLEAAREGGDAARAGKSAADCPYDETPEPTAEDFKRHYWFKGFRVASQDAQ